MRIFLVGVAALICTSAFAGDTPKEGGWTMSSYVAFGSAVVSVLALIASVMSVRATGRREIAKQRIDWMNILREKLAEYQSTLATSDESFAQHEPPPN